MPEKTVKRRLQDCDAALDIVRRDEPSRKARCESAYLRVC